VGRRKRPVTSQFRCRAFQPFLRFWEKKLCKLYINGYEFVSTLLEILVPQKLGILQQVEYMSGFNPS